jgi:hypothetical protein
MNSGRTSCSAAMRPLQNRVFMALDVDLDQPHFPHSQSGQARTGLFYRHFDDLSARA